MQPVQICLVCIVFSHIRNVCILGEASEEEEEIRGGTGGGECRPVGNGHSSRDGAHLQYHEGCAAMYAGKFEYPHTGTGTCMSLVFLTLKCHLILQNQMESLRCKLCMLGGVDNTAATEAFQSDLQYCFLSARMEATVEG